MNNSIVGIVVLSWVLGFWLGSYIQYKVGCNLRKQMVDSLMKTMKDAMEIRGTK